MDFPSGVNSSPQAYSAPSSPPRAANSHSASVGSALPAHCRVRFDVLVGHVHDRMFPQSLEAAARSLRMPPVGASHVGPPVVRIPKVDRASGLAEHHCRRLEQFRLGTRVVRRVRRPLGKRDVPGSLDKAAKVRVRHRVSIHPETGHCHLVRGRLLRIVVIGPHEKGAAWNPDHALRRRFAGWRRTFDALLVLRGRIYFHHRFPFAFVCVDSYTARMNTAPNANSPMKINAIAIPYSGVILTVSPIPATDANSLLHK